MTKINVIIDLKDLYIDEGEKISDAITNAIISGVTYDVKLLAKKQIEEIIIKPILKEFTLKKLCDMISSIITEDSGINASGINHPKKREDGTLGIGDYIEFMLKNANGSDIIKRHIGDVCSKYTDEAKKKLDLYFAAQLVARMNEKGMIAEDVLKAITY